MRERDGGSSVSGLRRVRLGRAVFLLVASAAAHASDFVPPASAQAQMGTPILVVVHPWADAAQVASDHARTHAAAITAVFQYALNGYAAVIAEERTADVRSDPRVEFVSQDHAVRALGQRVPTGVDRINAEPALVNDQGGDGVEVAVLDTGIATAHPDLAANIAGGWSCAPGKSFDDRNGHGTHVAGIIAAADNTFGVVGVAPRARLWSVRVLDHDGFGRWSWIICGLDFVAKHSPALGGSVRVVNISAGGPGGDDGQCGRRNHDALHRAVCTVVARGVVVVAAAGNETSDLAHQVPAAYDEVIAVSALADSDGWPCGLGNATAAGNDDTYAGFSNFATGSDAGHLLGAPGVNIVSTAMNGDYEARSGTSTAAPHVAGVVARYLGVEPSIRPDQIFSHLFARAESDDPSAECALGPSHTDPSGTHPERVVRADPPLGTTFGASGGAP